MSPYDELLLVFSFVFCVVMVAMALIPYLKGKSELMTSWNLFLGGSLVFVGLSGVNSVYSGHYFTYTKSTYLYFFLGITLFYTVAALTYHYLHLPRTLAKAFPKTWPPNTGKSLFFLTCLAVGFTALQFIRLPIPGLSRFLFNTAVVAPTIGLTLAFAFWWQNKVSVLTNVVLAVSLVISLYAAFSLGGGRRPLYGTLLAAPFGIYWWWLRQYKPWKVVGIAVLAIFPMLALDGAYQAVRWYGVRTTVQLDRKQGAAERLNRMLEALVEGRGRKIASLGQTSVEYSLVATKFYLQDKTFPTSPLHALNVLATFPIPRSIWEGKPEHLGLTLLFDTGVMSRRQRTNCGPGIVGHSAHEGGYHILVVYGILLGIALRYIDELLVRHSGNPLLIGFLAASSGHIIGWSRGDISSFSIWPICAFVFILGLSAVGRAFNGTVRAPSYTAAKLQT